MRPARLTTGIRPALLLGAASLAAYASLYADAYGLRVLTVAGVYALLVIGYQFIFGQAGALSLAQGAFFGLGAYATGILGTALGWPFALTFPASILVPVALAAAIAMPVLRLGSHYFALATLGIGQVVLIAAVNWESVTGGANGIAGVPRVDLFGFVPGRGWPMLAFVWALVALAAALAWHLGRGLTGLRTRLMREAPIAAGAAGIDTGALRFRALLLSAGYGGAAGALQVHTLGVVSPEVLEFPVMVAALTMAVIGGRARIAGAILGAVLLVHLPEWLRFLELYYMMAYGAGALAFIILAPAGLIGAFESLRARLWPEPPEPAPGWREPPVVVRAPPAGGEPLMEIEGLTKRFGGVAALASVSLSIQPGEIFGLIGPNGSGKTTLVNLVTGLDRPDAGRVRFAGSDVTGVAAHRMARVGVARGFQAVSLVEDMSALDNVAAACGTGTAGRGAAAFARARGEAVAFLDAMGAADWAMRLAGALPPGARRRVEIARALALQPALLILDEPAAGLTAAEQADLARRLEALAAAGMTLLVIEHDMGFLMPLAHRIACLVEGRLVATGTPGEIGADARVIAAYLGTTIAEPAG